MKKKIIIAVIIVFAIIAIVAGVMLITRYMNPNAEIPSGTTKPIEKGEKLISGYIDIMKETYYIKYSGMFSINKTSEKMQATVEYTKNKEDYALNSKEMGVGLVKKGSTLYSISHTYKMVMELPITTVIDYNYDMYSKIADIEKGYVGDGKETVDRINCFYEEYKNGDTKTRCYFVRDELKFVRITTKDSEELLKIEEIKGKVENELFEIPTTYTKDKAR